MSSEIKVISFDLDDTLWPGLPTILRAERLLYQWMTEHTPAISQQYDIHQLRDKRRALLNDRPQLAHDLTRLRIESFEQLNEEFGLNEDWIQPAFKIFYEARQRVELFDDVRPVLDALQKEFRLASLTNGNADVVKTGVHHWFDYSLNSIGAGSLKAEPVIYQQLQKLADIEAHQMVHIGDDPLQDVAGAKAAGAFAIWLNRDQQDWSLAYCKPDAVISSLTALPAALAQLHNRIES
ncbi:MAG: HAD-IA family hydrolase [Proteobacteria bacterium]|nr:HAD-IA family hydrolase [Pseudomonadota bacterium]